MSGHSAAGHLGIWLNLGFRIMSSLGLVYEVKTAATSKTLPCNGGINSASGMLPSALSSFSSFSLTG